MTSSEWPTPLARAISQAGYAACCWLLWTGMRLAIALRDVRDGWRRRGGR